MSGEGVEAKEKKLQAAKEKFVEESRFDPTRARYGLFSFTGTLAVGDDSVGRRVKPKRDAEGNVTTAPRNFYTVPPKKGKNPSALFSATTYASIGDPYRDPIQLVNPRKANAHLDDAPAFKPAGNVDTSFFAYPYEAVAAAEKKIHRDDSGAVITGPKNFLVSPCKKEPFIAFPATSNEPYERKWQLAREERMKHRSLMRQDRAFRSTSPGGKEFSTLSETYGPVELKPALPRIVHSEVGSQHDRPFRPPNPAKTSVLDMTIGRYPEHKPCPVSRTPSPPPFERPWK